jgi:hypothetical protein
MLNAPPGAHPTALSSALRSFEHSTASATRRNKAEARRA